MLWNIFLFFIMIILFHFLWNYIKNTFSIKKKKYLNPMIDKYRQIMEENISLSNENLPIQTDIFNDNLPIQTELEQDLELFLQNNI